MISILVLIVFLLSSVFNIFSHLIDYKKGAAISKTLLMPTLALYYVISSSDMSFLILLALLCSFIGDLFLLDNLRIKHGLIAFMVGHGFYIGKFALNLRFENFQIVYLIFLVPYVFYLPHFIKKLIPSAGKIKGYLIAYSVIISIMSYLALLNSFINPSFQSYMIFFGSLLFIISDNILAYSIFIYKKKYHNLFIMITYILAQFFIVIGIK